MSATLAETALLIVDLQNDFLHPEGAYGRAGQASAEIAALPDRIAPLAGALRAAGGSVVSTQFTLVPGRHGAPLIAPHLKQLRPFLTQGDFAPGSWGNAMVDSLQPADFAVEKVAYSAFYMSRLELVLRRAGLSRLIVCGIVTNGGVAATLRDAHVRDFETILLSDGCAAFKPEVHDVTIASLSSVSPTMTCAEALVMVQNGA
ncbi:cysteine hydrolase family protein [Arenibacterium halophilum]|uniref:Cysteine hydrolase n=1 Tax=Arenibacterium halophilum TaxID=2583821 RepID=A0ABY2XES5_9RHOB|nr:cysteine hydrolase [Arenibacterium halophilum]TMV15515.1 cysteine hydrolase [Arenibacterium halophilum]